MTTDGQNREGASRWDIRSHARRRYAKAKAANPHELEMALNRLGFAVVLTMYFQWAKHGEDSLILTEVYLFTAYSLSLFVSVLLRPAPSFRRRLVAMLCDLGSLSLVMHVNADSAAALYPIYFWIVLGNGFRFGNSYLALAATIGVVGFSTMAGTTQFWLENQLVAAGFLVGLVVIPAYASTLVRKLNGALDAAERARGQAVDASAAKDMFLASVSHELRTPLNAVIGMSELLRDTPLTEDQNEMARTIGSSGRLLLSLLDGILDFSRLNAGQMPLDKAAFDLHEVLAEVKRIVAVKAQEKGLSIALHVDATISPRVFGNRRSVEEILLNLGSNAVKFTERGSVMIAVERCGGDRLRFEVVDSGMGIAPEAHGRIFESFRQADATIVNRFGGTGLGLSICKLLVEQQGGSVGVASEPGFGSTFWFEIDMPPADAGTTGPQSEPSVEAVLVAGGAAEVAAQACREGGYPLQKADDVESAIGILRTPLPPGISRRLVLLDEGALAQDLDGVVRSLRTLGDPGEVCIALARSEGEGGGLPSALRGRILAALPHPLTRDAFANALGLTQMLATGGDASPDWNAIADREGGRRLEVLVAEDNLTNQRVIGKMLERAGHNATIASDGSAALDHFAERNFDIVLMDVNMPVMDGLEATRHLRFMEAGSRRTPVIALTADVTPATRKACLEAGMDACEKKPIDVARLFSLVADLTRSAPPVAMTKLAATPSKGADVESATALDAGKLQELEELGGAAFVSDLLGSFLKDAHIIMRDFDVAVTAGDQQAFREAAHAMRSCAANVGANGIFKIGLDLRDWAGEDVKANGARSLERIRAEFARVEKAIESRKTA